MKLPIKIYIDEGQTKATTGFIENWMSKNRELLHTASLEGCKILSMHSELNSVDLLDLISVGYIDEQEEVVAVVCVDRDGSCDTIDACIEWFVETEQYERADEALKIKTKLQSIIS